MTLIAHLSDTHLDGSEQRLGRLRAVLDQIAELPDVDGLLISGDLCDNGEPAEYDQFFSALSTALPIVAIPGNHDLSEPLLDALLRWDGTDSLNRSADIGHVRLIGLDSHIDDHDEGRLSPETLDFARGQIAEAPGPVVLAMHHPAVTIGHHLMDPMNLTTGNELEELVRGHDSIIGILTGHVHTALASSFAGVPLIGAPGVVSTMRLGSKTDPIADATAMPGLALHRIDGTHIQTVFHYLSPGG